MKRNKIMALLVAASMIFGSTGTIFAAPTFPDMPNDWSTAALESAVEKGYISGMDGKLMPKANLTRAQLASIMNRVFNNTEKADLSAYTDVPASAWYADDMAKAVKAGIFVGSDGKLSPENNITREEAFAVLSRAMGLSKGTASDLSKFSDSSSVSSWAVGDVAALVSAGIVNGSDGRLNPKANITRAEFAVILYGATGDNTNQDNTDGFKASEANTFSKAGKYSEVEKGNVMISAGGVDLSDVTIEGDLLISKEVGNGSVTLNNVTVTGETFVEGGGENSIHFVKCNLKKMKVANKSNTTRIVKDTATIIGDIIAETSAIFEGKFNKITVHSNVTFLGDVKTVIVAKTAIVKVNSGTISSIRVEEEAESTEIRVAKNATVTLVVVYGKSSKVTGEGKVVKVEANADKVSVSTPNTTVIAAEGTTGVLAGNKVVEPGKEATTSGSTGGGGGGGGGSSSSDKKEKVQLTLKEATDNVKYANGVYTVTVAKTDVEPSILNISAKYGVYNVAGDVSAIAITGADAGLVAAKATNDSFDVHFKDVNALKDGQEVAFSLQLKAEGLKAGDKTLTASANSDIKSIKVKVVLKGDGGDTPTPDPDPDPDPDVPVTPGKVALSLSAATGVTVANGVYTVNVEKTTTEASILNIGAKYSDGNTTYNVTGDTSIVAVTGADKDLVTVKANADGSFTVYLKDASKLTNGQQLAFSVQLIAEGLEIGGNKLTADANSDVQAVKVTVVVKEDGGNTPDVTGKIVLKSSPQADVTALGEGNYSVKLFDYTNNQYVVKSDINFMKVEGTFNTDYKVNVDNTANVTLTVKVDGVEYTGSTPLTNVTLNNDGTFNIHFVNIPEAYAGKVLTVTMVIKGEGLKAVNSATNEEITLTDKQSSTARDFTLKLNDNRQP